MSLGSKARRRLQRSHNRQIVSAGIVPSAAVAVKVTEPTEPTEPIATDRLLRMSWHMVEPKAIRGDLVTAKSAVSLEQAVRSGRLDPDFSAAWLARHPDPAVSAPEPEYSGSGQSKTGSRFGGKAVSTWDETPTALGLRHRALPDRSRTDTARTYRDGKVIHGPYTADGQPPLHCTLWTPRDQSQDDLEDFMAMVKAIAICAEPGCGRKVVTNHRCNIQDGRIDPRVWTQR